MNLYSIQYEWFGVYVHMGHVLADNETQALREYLNNLGKTTGDYWTGLEYCSNLRLYAQLCGAPGCAYYM